MVTKIIMAGYGGQGVLSAGKLLAHAGMLQNRNVSWWPSYGPEMRGGTANCHIIVSDKDIGSPIINKADVLIVMNKQSLDRFENEVIINGTVISDSSLVEKAPFRRDIKHFALPATKFASEIGNIAYANMVLIGKLIAITENICRQSIIKAIEMVLPEHKHHMIPDEIKALDFGINN